MTIYTGTEQERESVRKVLRSMRNTGDDLVFSLVDDGILKRFNLPDGTIAYASQEYLGEIAIFRKTGPKGFEHDPSFFDFDVELIGLEKLTPERSAEIRLATALHVSDLEQAGAQFVGNLPHAKSVVYKHPLLTRKFFYFETGTEGQVTFKKTMSY